MGLVRVGVIGGSGVYQLNALQNPQAQTVETPWGRPSADLVVGEIGGHEFAFLPRHGAGHRFSPTDIPYQANIYAMRMLGVERIVSVSAVGSLCEEYVPGDFVLPDQFVDRTTQRQQSFFGEGLVAHVPLAKPVDEQMASAVLKSGQALGLKIHHGGSYVTIEGPQFSTQAESELFRTWGCKLVGMTNGSEAKLAREAGMEFCTIAMVTDFDCWHPDHQDVDVAQVVAVAKSNATSVSGLLEKSLPQLAQLGESRWAHVLDDAVMTAKEHRCPEMMQRTAALFRSS